ncbi:LysM peptidoglycan-binding domain-containing protein [Liquorilactobacillus hordei]|uniref:LysM peptidoglycan-binding domain-containing protein n=1 Tax=Liquorilactobacillus hordei TaxID=468911 RepID=UPI001CC1678D|nr:LysM peptidoglycan-binding domain-containing protein [Liquorilactobacillus hordei]MBZ2405107.1 lysin [Liquorilactobacillus hordei]
MKFKKILAGMGAFIAPFIFVTILSSANTLGFDVASYQDSTPVYMQSLKDKGGSFVLAKLGGSGGGEGIHYKNPKASAQLASASSVGMEIGSYFWGQFGSDQSAAIKMANMAIDDAQRVGLKTGSVIALDYEAGATGDKEANTQAIITFMETIEKANYKAVLYSGASYLRNYINVDEVGGVFGARVWVASYKTMNYQYAPDFRYFPSMNYIAMWQYGSNVYGIDGNVDLTNLMKHGDVKNDVKVTPTAPKVVVSDNTVDGDMTYYSVKSGDSWWSIANKFGLDMYQLAKLNGQTISTVIHPNDQLKLKGTLKNDAKPVQKAQSSNYYTVHYGDSWWSIAYANGMNMHTLANLNGKSIYSVIYPGQTLKISGSVTTSSKVYYTVKKGDTVSKIANNYGISTSQIKNLSGLKNINLIFIGQSLRIK